MSYGHVKGVPSARTSALQMLSPDPSTLGEVLADVRRLGEAAGAEEAAEELLREAADRLDRVQAAVDGEARPRVAALEWLDPPYVGGHWVPQMIELAGGEDPLGMPGEKSRVAAWEEIAAAEPEVVIVIPCGYNAAQAADAASVFGDQLGGLGARIVQPLDAAAFFSRPGPRLVDGVELLARILHPSRADVASSAVAG